MRPVITLLTDFGTSDHYVAAMKGVMLLNCPDVQFIDISHDVSSYDVQEAAYTLAHAWHCFPKGTVHLVVVDPGVGGARRPILAEGGGHLFVAPDNGVLSMIFDAIPRVGVRHIQEEKYFRRPVSRTFHGRDIFAPVAAHLAAGEPSSAFGPLIDDAVRLRFAAPIQTGPATWTGQVLKIDRFGNIITNFASDAFREISTRPFELRVGNGAAARYCGSYSAAGTPGVFVIQGSSGYLEVSSNQQSAAEILAAQPAAPAELRYL